jgi:hypothetical protein
MKTIRKALLAGGAAAVAVAATQIVKDGLPATRDGWLAVGGAMLGAFAVAAVAVYQVPNAKPAP